MKRLADCIQSYVNYHKKPATRLTHYFGVPMVIIGLMIALQWIQIEFGGHYTLSLGWLVTLMAAAFYVKLDWAFGLLLTLLFFIFMSLVSTLVSYHPTWHAFISFLILFGGGWALQFLGHFFEKNRPAFLSNITQLLMAPLFLVVELMESRWAEKYFPKLSSWLLLRLGAHNDH